MKSYIKQFLNRKASSEYPAGWPCRSKPFLFIHIPKCAGTSISMSLLGYQLGHFRMRDYLLLDQDKRLPEIFKFTFVRHPYDRMLSAYNFLKRGGMHRTDEESALKYLSAHDSFDSFVDDCYNKQSIPEAIHFTPQFQFLTVTDKSYHIGVDFAGKTEYIATDLQFIATRLPDIFAKRISNHTSKSFMNRTRATEASHEIDADTFGKVAELYAKDFLLFGYSDFSTKETYLTWKSCLLEQIK